MERTVVNFSSEFDKISPTESILLLGSCFSANIGNALKEHKFVIEYNPFGVLFHPQAIYTLLKRAMDDEPFVKADFFERDLYWFSFDLGANTGEETIEEAVAWSNIQLELLKDYLKKSSRLILTFGTAFGFFKEGGIVGNCHKMNSSLFNKKLTSLEALEKESFTIIEQLNAYNPKLKISLTVSPVRHVKEGLRNNNLSKSILLLLTSSLEKRYSNVEYLPVYELVLDELRDYSFFKSDLLHLNDKGIAVVWQRFSACTMNSESLKFIKEVTKILNQLNHKSLYPKSSSNIKFKKGLIQQMEQHQEQFSELWFTEIQRVKIDVDKLE